MRGKLSDRSMSLLCCIGPSIAEGSHILSLAHVQTSGSNKKTFVSTFLINQYWVIRHEYSAITLYVLSNGRHDSLMRGFCWIKTTPIDYRPTFVVVGCCLMTRTLTDTGILCRFLWGKTFDGQGVESRLWKRIGDHGGLVARMIERSSLQGVNVGGRQTRADPDRDSSGNNAEQTQQLSVPENRGRYRSP